MARHNFQLTIIYCLDKPYLTSYLTGRITLTFKFLTHLSNSFAFYLLSYSVDGQYYYGVRIVTGSPADSTVCDGDIEITLVGNEAVSSGNCVLSWLDTFRKKSRRYFDFILVCDGSLGEVLVVILHKNASLISQWYIDFVEVYNFEPSQKRVFPCYFWIGNNDSIYSSSATSEF